MSLTQAELVNDPSRKVPPATLLHAVDGDNQTDAGWKNLAHRPVETAVALLSQQIWCWGRDILRTKGNWLVEFGFVRTEPPANRRDCTSMYTLNLANDRCILLRGFGAFYGDRNRGGVFLPRFEFRPRYTKTAAPQPLPWSDEDLPKLQSPTESERTNCASLTLDLLDWIREYEVTVRRRLGTEYRRSTLRQWKNGKRLCVSAEEIPAAWRELSFRVAADFGAFLRNA